MNTPLLNITEVASFQNNKEVTINDAFIAIERSLNDSLSLDFTAGNITLLTADATRYGVLVCINAAASRTLTIPASKRIFAVKNDSLSTITVGTGTGTTSAVQTSTRALLFCDGTNVHYIAQGGQPGAALFYDLGFQYIGTPGNHEKQEFLTVRGFTLPATGGSSLAKAGIAATADTIFSIQKNGTEIGQIKWLAAGTTGAFTVAADTAFASGDMLSIVAPLVPDATLADIAITCACTR